MKKATKKFANLSITSIEKLERPDALLTKAKREGLTVDLHASERVPFSAVGATARKALKPIG